MYQRKVRTRPVAAVAAEYASFPGKVIIFWDDNWQVIEITRRLYLGRLRLTANGGVAKSAFRQARMQSF